MPEQREGRPAANRAAELSTATTSSTSTVPRWESVPLDLGEFLDGVAADWPGGHFDAAWFERTIRAVAERSGGIVDPNQVRPYLTGVVKPQRVGPLYRRACLDGWLVPAGWTISDDRRGRNIGRPVRVYRLIGGGEA